MGKVCSCYYKHFAQYLKTIGALCEPMSCILHGWNRIENKMRMNKKVLIVGSGIIGNLWASLLHFKGIRNVCVSEASELRRQITETMGIKFFN